jgi:hypothetical protein
VIDGNWLAVRDGDARLYSMNRRHYSRTRSRDARCGGKVAGPGEYMALLTQDGLACFIWKRMRTMDGQEGTYCSIFRNEGAGLSSQLIREADELAWRRWPGERHFTYVEDDKVISANPGYCFLKAGWTRCGRNADGRLTILERLP